MTTTEGRLTPEREAEIDRMLATAHIGGPAMWRVLSMLSNVRAELAAVRRELDEARNDSARLDWMQESDAEIRVADDEVASCYVQSNRDYMRSGESPHGYDVRAAIDAAMAKDGDK